jgi:hypothetical protein
VLDICLVQRLIFVHLLSQLPVSLACKMFLMLQPHFECNRVGSDDIYCMNTARLVAHYFFQSGLFKDGVV